MGHGSNRGASTPRVAVREAAHEAAGPAGPGTDPSAIDGQAPGVGPDAGPDSAALAALRRRVARLEEALDVARLGVWRRDLRSGATEWSPQMFTLFGFDRTAGPPSPEAIDACLTPASVARRAAALRNAAPGTPFEAELELQARDGVRRWILQRGEAELDKAGAVVAIHGTAMDITRRREAEEALVESEARFRASLDGMLEGCSIVDRSWRIVYLNEAAARHRRGERSQLLGRSMQEIRPDFESSDIFERYRRCMEERIADRFDTMYEFPGGPRAWYELSIQPVPEGILVLTIDRTVEREAALEREAAAARDRLLVQEAADAIYRIEPSGRILDANPAWLAMLGRAEDEVRGHFLQEFFTPEDEVPLRIPPAGVEAGVAVERWLVRADGQRVLQSARLHGLPDGTILASGRDITQERERADRLVDAARLESLGRLAGGVAHGFNNLMTTVIGTASLLQSETPPDDPRRPDIDAIRTAGERAAALTSQLLAFGQRQMLRPVRVDIAVALDRIAEQLRRELRPGVTLAVAAGPDAGIVRVDPSQLEQVAANLVLNAQDALPTGGSIVISAMPVEVNAAQAARHADVEPGPFIRLDVRDQGLGIDAAVLPHIFEPFYTTKEFGHGFGLGLATVVGVVGQSGGWIEVSSAPRAGTTFSVFLPAERAAAAAAESVAAPVGGSERILLAEDEPQVRAVTGRILRALGYEVHDAGSAEEVLALDADTVAGFDLLMADVTLGSDSGAELAARLQAARPGLRVLFVSGYAPPDSVSSRLGEAGVGFLAKPYRRAELAAAIRSLLDAPPGGV